MSASFTPGPWWGGTEGSPWYVRRESDDACIAHMEDGGHCDPDIILIDDDEREANARLIAAAPDNFACNKASTAILEIILAEDWIPDSAKKSIRDQVVLNKRSIARATGEQP